MSGLIGKKLGGYRIEEEIGQGGMGMVYRATQVELDRTVALKLLPPQFTIDPAFIQRFRREARAVAQLNHPNIVQIYEIGVDHSTHFFAMEYVDGDTLDEHIFRTYQLPVPEAVRIIVQVCRGLQTAHDAGIVHRDIKPANIILDRQGRAKLMDFGIAYTPSASRLTATGGIVGTPEYMSPEQASGGTITPQSDIYSLGIVLYEALTGVVPFENEQSVVTLQQHQYDEPKPPGEINKAVPLALEQILLKMLAKDCEARYTTCNEVIADLRAITSGSTADSSATGVHTTGARGMPTAARPPASWALFLGGAGLLATGAVLAVLLRGASPPAPPPVSGGAPPAPADEHVADAAVLAQLATVYAEQARLQEQRDRVQLRLRHGGQVTAADARLDDGMARLSVAGVGAVCLPRDALAAEEPLRITATPAPVALFGRAGRDWAGDVLETWKLEHGADVVASADLPAILDIGRARLPQPEVAHRAAWQALADACVQCDAAAAVLAEATGAHAAARSAAPDSVARFPDRVMLKSGHEIACRIVDAESSADTLVVELQEGGRMTIRFAELRHWDRAYGQAASAADNAAAATAQHRTRMADARTRVQHARAAAAEAHTRRDAAVSAFLAATESTADVTEPAVSASADAAAPVEPQPVALVSETAAWEETFAGGAFFAGDEWNGWHIMRECGQARVRLDGEALLLSTHSPVAWTGCPPHVYRRNLAVAHASAVEVTLSIRTPPQVEGGLLASWIEVEGVGVPPLAYLVYSSDPLAPMPGGQAQHVPLIQRPALWVSPDGEPHTIALPVADDWAAGGDGAVTLTGIRLIHYRTQGDRGQFLTRFDAVRIFAQTP